MSSPTRSLLALALVSVAAATGCGELKTLVEDALERAKGGDQGGATGPVGGTGAAGSGDASLTCDAVTNADGTVCKRCIDATGVVVREDCPPSATGGGGTTGAGGTGAATGGSCIRIEGRRPDELQRRRDLEEVRQRTLRAAEPGAERHRVRRGLRRQLRDRDLCLLRRRDRRRWQQRRRDCVRRLHQRRRSVCKRCVDASGVVIIDDCPSHRRRPRAAPAPRSMTAARPPARTWRRGRPTAAPPARGSAWR